MGMFGKITVGDGGVEPTAAEEEEEKEDKKADDAPGFVGVTAIVALLGAVLFARMRKQEE